MSSQDDLDDDTGSVFGHSGKTISFDDESHDSD